MPLPISIPDPFDEYLGARLFLDRSYNKPGTKNVRVHIFKSKAGYCECCGHTTEEREFAVEVNNYGTRSFHSQEQ